MRINEIMQPKTIQTIIRKLNKLYGIQPHRSKPFETLIGVVLSHRTKDDVGVPASRRLFAVADSPEKMLKLSEKEIAKIIYPVGFYNQKAKRIRQICKMILEEFGGKVPKTREELMKLPGVGGKSADIVLLFSFGEYVIPVDTHVAVISRRWHLTENKDPEKIREDLHKIFKGKRRVIVNNLLVEFGKEYCTARYPKCKICPVLKLCPYENKNF
jgi:endonuclease-3